MEEREPRVNWTDVMAVGFILIGLLVLLIILHILAISTSGNIGDVLNTTFEVFMTLWIAITSFVVIGIIIQLLRWLTWSINTPNWRKKRARE